MMSERELQVKTSRLGINAGETGIWSVPTEPVGPSQNVPHLLVHVDRNREQRVGESSSPVSVVTVSLLLVTFYAPPTPTPQKRAMAASDMLHAITLGTHSFIRSGGLLAASWRKDTVDVALQRGGHDSWVGRCSSRVVGGSVVGSCVRREPSKGNRRRTSWFDCWSNTGGQTGSIERRAANDVTSVLS